MRAGEPGSRYRRLSGSEEAFEKRWALAAGACSGHGIEELEGGWSVWRLSGPVPMVGMYKRICGSGGYTGADWSPLRDAPFVLEQLKDSVMLRYRRPLSFLRDELRQEGGGSWLGRAYVGGVQYAWFSLTLLTAKE